MAGKDIAQESAASVPLESPKGKDFVQRDAEDGSITDNTQRDSSEARTGGLAGVQRIEATTQAWTKPWLIAAYVL